MNTGATLFQGFDGVGIGMRAAGIQPIWGIEQRPDVAEVAEHNGFRSIVSDILKVDPGSLPAVDFLHASPPCTNASTANANGKETDLDQQLAEKTVDFIRVIRPRFFTLENVWQYRKFVSFGIILGALEALGYWIDVAHVNAANFGVPQTRKRMILRAHLGGWLPNLPDPEPWIGWYEAIEDLIPTLPASQFAPWQLARLPEYLSEFMIGNGNRSAAVDSREPADTITGNHNQATTRAFLVDGQNQSSNHGMTTFRMREDPGLTVTSGSGFRAIWRAWLEQGRIVKLTSRALARLQSFPDSYQLPDKKSLACFGIGNAVPPRLMEKICRQLVAL